VSFWWAFHAIRMTWNSHRQLIWHASYLGGIQATSVPLNEGMQLIWISKTSVFLTHPVEYSEVRRCTDYMFVFTYTMKTWLISKTISKRKMNIWICPIAVLDTPTCTGTDLMGPRNIGRCLMPQFMTGVYYGCTGYTLVMLTCFFGHKRFGNSGTLLKRTILSLNFNLIWSNRFKSCKVCLSFSTRFSLAFCTVKAYD
jgi:hypothetical protein